MRNTPRAVAEDVRHDDTPVAGERLVINARSMYKKHELCLIAQVVLVGPPDGASRHRLVRDEQGVVLHDSLVEMGQGACNEGSRGTLVRCSEVLLMSRTSRIDSRDVMCVCMSGACCRVPQKKR